MHIKKRKNYLSRSLLIYLFKMSNIDEENKVPHFRKVYEQKKSDREVQLQTDQYPQDSFELGPMSFDEEVKAPIGMIIMLITSFLLSFVLIIIGAILYEQKHDTKNAVGIWVLAFLVMIPGLFSIYKIIVILAPKTPQDRVNILHP
ncbi:unnamed protein product [Blepharisma stoltei]|uniref:Transmembrane protein 230 n=1 Tax=Blepharisma stoltei TaxID=1481888 RepID=A0AAU9KK64_9CILI|nr:unnamed protein product [Blepharisma stoltei]